MSSHGPMKITKNPNHFIDRLEHACWDKRQVTMIMERLCYLAEQGEDPLDICRRLNPPARQPASMLARDQEGFEEGLLSV